MCLSEAAPPAVFLVPGASVAAIGTAHGINATILRRDQSSKGGGQTRRAMWIESPTQACVADTASMDSSHAEDCKLHAATGGVPVRRGSVVHEIHARRRGASGGLAGA